MMYLVQLIVMILDPIIFVIVLVFNFMRFDGKLIIVYGLIGGLLQK